MTQDLYFCRYQQNYYSTLLLRKERVELKNAIFGSYFLSQPNYCILYSKERNESRQKIRLNLLCQ